MDYQVSARKYRPSTFADVIGQPHVVQTLLNAISTKRVAHAYLFSGTRGVGKTTVARLLAKALNCEQGPTSTPCNRCASCIEVTRGSSADVVEIDGASNTSVDDVREIRENIKFMPFRGHYRVYIIDEVHMLSTSAFNALLKTLEEPPPHVVFIFATTEIHKIPATILSRCQHYNFRRLTRTEIVERLRHVARQEHLVIEDRSLIALARASEGSMRDALSLLDQAVSFGGKTVRHQDLEVLLGAVPHELVQGLTKAVVARDYPKALGILASVLDHGHDLRTFCAEVIEQFRNVLVASVVQSPAHLESLIEASQEEVEHLATEAQTLTPDELQELLAIFVRAEDSLRLSMHPRFIMEAAIIRAIRSLHRSAHPRETTPTQEALAAPETVACSANSTKKPASSSVSQDDSSSASSPSSSSSTRSSSTRQTNPTSLGVRASKSITPSLAAEGSLPPHLGGQTFPQEDKVTAPLPSPQPSVPDEPVLLNWEAIQEEIAASLPNIAPFLETGRYLGVKDGAVTIGFAKHNHLARTRLEKEEHLRALARLCEQQVGRPVRIRIVELSEADPPGPTMAQVRTAKEQDQRLVLFERARAHPVVKQAMEIFGAELADVRLITKKEATE
ncbi:MAG: DNA polymerase III subunit gamma/tau [Nitrospira sp.]|nr:DNA polymerase III subunit gamma/tau [Nitrospira sp.]